MSVAVEEGRLPQLGRSAEQECERLFARHAHDVRRYVRMVLRNGSDVDDVVQQTFLKALRALQAGVRPERPRQWLIAIAHNECRMLFRRNARRPFEVDLDEAAEAVAAEDGSTSVEAVREALEQLAPNQRQALVLRELEGRTYDEIATTLELSGSAVETLLFRARRALREQLETVGSCDDAQALLAADELDELARRRLRAHTRSCRPCATLERRRRGRLAAAGRKLGALLPLPQWLPSLFEGGAGGAKAVAVVAAAAVATTSAVAGKGTQHAPAAKPAPQAATPVVRSMPHARVQTARHVVRAVPAAAPRHAVTVVHAPAPVPVAPPPAPAPASHPTSSAAGEPGPAAAPTADTETPPRTPAAPPPAAPAPLPPAVDAPPPDLPATVTVPSAQVDPPPVNPGNVVPPAQTPTVTVTVPTLTLPSLTNP